MSDSSEKPKPTLDERLGALTQSLELLTRDVEAMRERMEAADRRERKARQAILTGIAAYLRALDANGDEPQDRT
jgi:hypothetical protein